MLLCMAGPENPDLLAITDGLILEAEFDSESQLLSEEIGKAQSHEGLNCR